MKPAGPNGTIQFGHPAGAALQEDWHRRGNHLFARGDRKGAADAYVRYLAERLRNPVLIAIADDVKAGRLARAEIAVRRYLSANRSDPVAYRMLGQIAQAGQNNEAAEAIFRRVLDLAPASLPVRFDLVSSLYLQGRFAEALTELRPLLRAAPRDARFLSAKAALLSRSGDFTAAGTIFADLLKARPDDAGLLISHGQSLRTQRRRDEAIAAFRRVIALQPHHGEAWWNLANLKAGVLDGDDIAQLRAVLASGAGSTEDRYHLHFALARALEEAGAYAQALAEYNLANAGRLALLPPQAGPTSADRASRARALFTRAFIAEREGQGDHDPAPIFILGMPRSGSTLLEQILASHPLVEGTQELTIVPLLARALDREGGAGVEGAYPEMLAGLSPERWRALGSAYLAKAREKRATDRPIFLDKQPANWLHAGLIHLMLPRARIIDMRRDRLDCCLSMFRQHFARGAEYTYSIDGLAREYRAYEDLMAHFDAAMPGRIKRVMLADLVADIEATVRDVLGYLELPFAPECLRFFESDRAVFTPSSEQVRRPINCDADQLMTGFRPYLGDLSRALGEQA